MKKGLKIKGIVGPGLMALLITACLFVLSGAAMAVDVSIVKDGVGEGPYKLDTKTEDVSGMTLSVTTALSPSSIGGHIKDSDGFGLTGLSVFLIPSASYSGGGAAYQTTQTLDAGKYSFGGLPTGSYIVFPVSDTSNGECYKFTPSVPNPVNIAAEGSSMVLDFSAVQCAGACNYGLTASSASFTSASGAGSVTVAAPDGCAWTAGSNASWLSITSGSSGTGIQPVNYSVAQNTGALLRSGTMTIAGLTFTANQDGAPQCTYSLVPASASLASGAGSGSVQVSTQSGCAWTASSSDTSWLTTTSAGTGSGTISYSVTANTGLSSRSATISAGGQSHTVTQAGASCTYSISPTTASYGSSGGTGTATVTAGAGCPWTASSSNTSWLTTASSGSGNGTVNYNVAANTGSASRTATITVGGQSLTVTESGTSTSTATCGTTIGLQKLSYQALAGGGVKYYSFDTTPYKGGSLSINLYSMDHQTVQDFYVKYDPTQTNPCFTDSEIASLKNGTKPAGATYWIYKQAYYLPSYSTFMQTIYNLQGGIYSIAVYNRSAGSATYEIFLKVN